MGVTIGRLAILASLIGAYIIARIQFPVFKRLDVWDNYYDANSGDRVFFATIYFIIALCVLGLVEVALDPKAFLYWLVHG